MWLLENLRLQGHLAGSVGGPCDSWPRGLQFKPYVEYRVYLKKKKIKITHAAHIFPMHSDDLSIHSLNKDFPSTSSANRNDRNRTINTTGAFLTLPSLRHNGERDTEQKADT